MPKGTKTYKIIVREDMQTGDSGWVVAELTEMEEQPSVAYGGPLIAHDIIEHVNGIESIGGIGEELQAMGGVWNTRGQFGDISRNNMIYVDPRHAMANSYVELGRRFIDNGEEIGCEIPELVKSKFVKEFQEIWDLTKDKIIGHCDTDEMEDGEFEEMLAFFHEAAESFFHLGVIKHQAEWGDGYSANVMYYGIVCALHVYSSSEDFLELTLDFDEERVTVERDFAHHVGEIMEEFRGRSR